MIVSPLVLILFPLVMAHCNCCNAVIINTRVIPQCPYCSLSVLGTTHDSSRLGTLLVWFMLVLAWFPGSVMHQHGCGWLLSLGLRFVATMFAICRLVGFLLDIQCAHIYNYKLLGICWTDPQMTWCTQCTLASSSSSIYSWVCFLFWSSSGIMVIWFASSGSVYQEHSWYIIMIHIFQINK